MSAKDLPACPVETTLTLIGDKWKGVDSPGLDARNKTLRRTEKVCRECITKGFDCTAARNGRQRAFDTHRLCRSTAASRVFPHRTGTKSRSPFWTPCKAGEKDIKLQTKVNEKSPANLCRGFFAAVSYNFHCADCFCRTRSFSYTYCPSP